VRKKFCAGFLLATCIVAPIVPASASPAPVPQQYVSDADSTNNLWILDRDEAVSLENQGVAVTEISNYTEQGFRADFEGATPRETQSGGIEVIDDAGNVLQSFLPAVPLKDGHFVPVTYTVGTNFVEATFEKPVKAEAVRIAALETRSAGGCALGALATVAEVAGGAAALISSPLDGPVGPLVATSIATGVPATVAKTAQECTE